MRGGAIRRQQRRGRARALLDLRRALSRTWPPSLRAGDRSRRDPDLPDARTRHLRLRPAMSARQIAPLYLAAAAFAIAVSLPGGDPDTYWHLASAKWMVEHGQLLRMDVFSSTVTGQPYSVGEWLGQLALYLAHIARGWTGLALLRATLVAIGAFFLTRAALRVAPAPFAIAIAAFALALSEITWTDRPQLFSLALFPMLFEVLIAARAGRTALLAAVPPLLLVWTNLHGGYALGLALLALFPGAPILTRRQPLAGAGSPDLRLPATVIGPGSLGLCAARPPPAA